MDLSKSYEDRSRTQQHHFPHDEHLNNLDISVIPPVQDSTIYINRKPSAPVVTVNPPKIIVTAFSKANQLNPVPITPQHRKVTFHEKRATQIPRTKIYWVTVQDTSSNMNKTIYKILINERYRSRTSQNHQCWAIAGGLEKKNRFFLCHRLLHLLHPPCHHIHLRLWPK